MAIFHLTATVISRARGQSAVAAAAYRTGTKLRDRRYGTTHCYGGRRAVEHAEIVAPPDTPEWVHHRETLWNAVEERERRRDAQLARVIEVGLPVELSPDQALTLLRDYVATTFVSQGMIADFGIRRDNPGNPHAHILLTLREVTLTGFGAKARHWNGKGNLLGWRAAWAERVNDHLAHAGHAVRIDHRTLEAQQIELIPARRMGVGRAAVAGSDLPEHLVERIAEQRAIAAENGAAMLEDPALALRSLAQQRPAFTAADVTRFLRTRTDGAVQLAAVQDAILRSADLIELRPGTDGTPRFTTRDMVDAAGSLRRRVVAMAARCGHGISSLSQQTLWARGGFGDGYRPSFDYLLSEGDIKALDIGPDLDKAALVAALRLACEAEGMQVITVTVSSLSSRLDRWQAGSEAPTRVTVIVADGAEMLSLKPLERLLAFADKGRAKLVLLADSLRLRAQGAESPLRDILSAIGQIPPERSA